MIWKGRLGNLHEHWNVIRDKHDLSRFGDFHEKFFFPFLHFFYFNLAHLFYGGGQVALESIEIICKPNFPLNISLYKLEMDSSPCFCHILLKCRIGTEQLQWILGKTGTTDLGIHTKEKASPKENVKRKITTKENLKGKSTIKSRIMQTSHQICCQETTFWKFMVHSFISLFYEFNITCKWERRGPLVVRQNRAIKSFKSSKATKSIM